MAYLLGYFAADGCMLRNNRGAHFIEFTSTDKELLETIRDLLSSSHKISRRASPSKSRPNWNPCYRLQIGSKSIYQDLFKLGFTAAKSNTIGFPDIPTKLLPHFIRGYFDGDGHVVVVRRLDRPSKAIQSGFTSGSKKFLITLHTKLKECAKIRGGAVRYHQGYRLNFSANDSKRLYEFIYKDSQDVFLERKRLVFEKYFNI